MHFLLAGIILFILSADKGTGELPKQIVVDRASLLTYLQYRHKVFDPDRLNQILDNFNGQELQTLVDEYVTGEALYREAIALGLNEGDYSLRQSLARKLDLINRNAISTNVHFTVAELNDYMQANAARYYVVDTTTFTHVFFSADKHGPEHARRSAKAELKRLNQSGVAFNEAISHGDRFPYHRNYVDKSAEEISSHFGVQMQQQIFALSANDNLWHGPYLSTYGYHLVMVAMQKAGYLPALPKVSDQVEMDAREQRLMVEVTKINQAIVDTYKVKLSGLPLLSEY